MYSPTEFELQALNDTVKAALEHARECYGSHRKFYKIHIRWNRRLTSSAGNAHYRTGKIKISQPIFFQAIEDIGLDKTLDELFHTVLHEISHILTGTGHDTQEFQDMMESMGADYRPYHKLRTGTDLYDPGYVWRGAYPVGRQAVMLLKGMPVKGRVVNHGTRLLHFLDEDRKRWKIPYTMLPEVDRRTQVYMMEKQKGETDV